MTDPELDKLGESQQLEKIDDRIGNKLKELQNFLEPEEVKREKLQK